MRQETTIIPIDIPDDPSLSMLDTVLREGGRRLLQATIEFEADMVIERLSDLRDEFGRQAIVRNGSMPERELATPVGMLSVKQPRVRDRRPVEERMTFTSAILPRYARRSPTIETLLPTLYLKGLSTGDFGEALASLLGPNAAGLSPATITRLLEEWQHEYREWSYRDLSKEHYVYLWVDGIHSNVRLTDERPCALVVIAAKADGHKELLAVVDGERESTDSWRELLLDLKARGMNTPHMTIADGALGFWKAVEEIYPATRQQLCWVHKIKNVTNALPKKLHPSAKEHLREIYISATRADAVKAFVQFRKIYEAKYPKACATIERNIDRLLSFYDLPAEHWVHLRTTNIIESTFATVRLRTRKTKGNGSRKATLAMIFKLGVDAERSWRRLNAPQQIARLLAGAKFVDGVAVENVDELTQSMSNRDHNQTEQLAAAA